MTTKKQPYLTVSVGKMINELFLETKKEGLFLTMTVCNTAGLYLTDGSPGCYSSSMCISHLLMQRAGDSPNCKADKRSLSSKVLVPYFIAK